MLATALLHLVSLLLAYAVSGRHTSCSKYVSGDNKDYDEALQFLQEHDPRQTLMMKKGTTAEWNYQSDLTEKNKKIMLKTQIEVAKFASESWKNATSFAWKDFKGRNETIYRWFKALATLRMAALPEEELKKFYQIVADMQDVFAKAKVCSKDNPPDKPCDLSLEPEITEMFQESRDYDELKRVWRDWRDATGKKVKSQFLEYVKLNNKAARLNGLSDAGEMWRDDYETENFDELAENLWKEIAPFYKQLHSYVRRKLFEKYPDKGIKLDGPIPAHILGNMWAQSWSDIFPILKPFPNKNTTDVSKKMKQIKMTPKAMFKLSEDFFVSLGLKPMTPEFWQRSIIEKPKGRELVCHATAWDFFDGKDFRIRMCTRVDMSDLITVHHEMGHIQYFQQYTHLPAIFRCGANPGFHEAVGDTLALSVSTTSHLKKIGLIDEAEEDNETVINSLMHSALDKIAFIPYGFLVDKWRWKVFNGEFSEDLNEKWWELRLKYQGLCPPVRRSEDDLDAAAKYHVVANIPYLRYFVSSIIQFQFHKALCDAAGYVGPLHECDIYQKKVAGELLSEALSLGSSVHWTEAMSIITRGKTRNIDVKPLLEYFEPLIKWLKKHNQYETIGWKSTDPMICPQN